MAEEKKNPLGTTGEHVRTNVERLRKERGWSYQALSNKLEAMGRPIPTLGLSRVEKGTRRVDADDLVALAQAFDVAPAALLLPATDNGEPVQVTGRPQGVSWLAAWRWITGEHPLFDPGAPDDPRGDAGWRERLRRYVNASRPYEHAEVTDEIIRLVSSRLSGDWRLEIDKSTTEDGRDLVKANLKRTTTSPQ